MINKLIESGWAVTETNYALSIAEQTFPEECEQLVEALLGMTLDTQEHFIKRGGGESDQTQDLSAKLNSYGWVKNNISIDNTIRFSQKFDAFTASSTSHEVDHIGQNHYGKKFALEIEWNNKDEFFDRDCSAFQSLYDLKAIELGVIITRGPDLEDGIADAVRIFFQENDVQDYEGLKALEEKIVDGKGVSRFSFPTEPQKNAIEKKLSNQSFSNAAAEVFCSSKYGTSTTTWGQLHRRIERGTAGRTPMLIIGIPRSIIS